MPPKKKLPKTREEILEQKRIAERLRYQRLKNDPQKQEEIKEKERLKYQKKKEKGSRKLVKDMSRREHKAAKKTWKEHCSKYRQKKRAMKEITNNFVRENTPDSIGSTLECPAPLRSSENALVATRKKQAKKKRAKILKNKDNKIQEYKQKLEKYKKRLQRLEQKLNKNSKKDEAPQTKLTRMCDTPSTRKDVVKKALFGEVLNKQLKENYAGLKTQKEKQIFGKVISGELVKKYKLWRSQESAVSYKRLQKIKNRSLLATTRTRLPLIASEHVKSVQFFYEHDDNSRIGAGKRECITRNGVKKQKRYLLDTMTNLYQKFKSNNSGLISYQTFCRLRPFWVVTPKINERDTCLCIRHANIDMKLSALYCRKILRYDNHNKLLEKTCCNRYDEQCLSRECQRCFNRNPDYQEFNNSKPILFKKWIAEKQDYKDPKMNKVRSITKYVKRILTVSPRELIQELHDELDAYYNHERNIFHQYKAIKELKENLNDNEVVILMDFSENYSTKYNEEIQAYHFGGSRLQLSLHTVVLYSKNAIKSYCTVSQNTTHSPAAIWEHLKPIFKTLPMHITGIHFVSDGPVTQYRNKTMFHILASRLHVEVPNVEKFSWNFSESGHGKSAADGIGATCKRSADAVVAAGGDIDSLQSFIDSVSQRCPSITLFTVDDDAIKKMTNNILKDSKTLKSFSGTLKIHQIKGIISRSPLGLPQGTAKLIMKSLSCPCEEECQHFNLGVMNYEVAKLRVEDLYTDSDSENEIPLAHITPNNDCITETGLSRPFENSKTDFENTAEPSTSGQQQSYYNNGDYVLVKFIVRNRKYRYAAVVNKVDNEDGELTVTFMKICDNKGYKFRIDENDMSDVGFDQILEKLPDPKVKLDFSRNSIVQQETELRELKNELNNVLATLENIENLLTRVKSNTKEKLVEAKRECNNKMPQDPDFPYMEQFEVLPADATALQEHYYELQTRMDCMEQGDEQVLKEYEEREKVIQKLKSDVTNSSDTNKLLEKKMQTLRAKWLSPLESLLRDINKSFGDMFAKLGCAGEIKLEKAGSDDDYDRYGICILVSFRTSEQLQQLTRHAQSGGERALSTAVYLMSLQALTTVPFRCVDEINQGMDPINERKMFQLLVKVTTECDNAQYFLLTPKLLTNLDYNDRIMVHTIMNGKKIMNYRKWNYQKFLESAPQYSEAS